MSSLRRTGWIFGAASVLAATLLFAGCGKKSGEADTGTKPCEPGVAAREGGIDTPKLKALMASETPPVIFDARSGQYDDGRRIPGAKGMGTSPAPEAVAKYAPSKDTLIVTYCTDLECPASAALHKYLTGTLGYTNVLEYPYGIKGWVEGGNDFEKAEPVKAAPKHVNPEEDAGEAPGDPGRLDTAELKRLLGSEKPPVLLDARGTKLRDWIPGAKAVGTEPDAALVAKLVSSKDSPVVTYCTNLQCPASGRLHRYLVDLGYTNVREYPHGIQGWLGAGNPVERSGEAK